MTTTPTSQAIAATILADKRQGTTFPTDLEAIVSSTRNLELERVDVPQQFEGRIELCRNTPTIFLNLHGRRFDHPRTRFTLGHAGVWLACERAQIAISAWRRVRHYHGTWDAAVAANPWIARDLATAIDLLDEVRGRLSR